MLILEILFKSFQIFNKQNKYYDINVRDGIFHFLIYRNDIRSLWSVSKIVLIEITYSKPNIPSFPLDPHEPKKKTHPLVQPRPSTISYNAYPAQSMPLNQRLVPRGIYCRNISGKLAALPRYIRWQSRPLPSSSSSRLPLPSKMAYTRRWIASRRGNPR